MSNEKLARSLGHCLGEVEGCANVLSLLHDLLELSVAAKRKVWDRGMKDAVWMVYLRLDGVRRDMEQEARHV
jgi:hypothetical protein